MLMSRQRCICRICFIQESAPPSSGGSVTFGGRLRHASLSWSVVSLSTLFCPVESQEYDFLNQRTRTDLGDDSYWSYDYDDLGQVTSGSRYWLGGVPVEGQQFGYGFDDIGNRTEATRDGRTAIYQANLLNQIDERDVPGFVDVLGHAQPEATVTVNLQNTTRQQDGYFHKALGVDNSSGDVYEDVRVVGVRSGAGPNGEDVVSEETGHAFLAGDPESFDYDLDGNLKKDGRWDYFWDGENRLIAMQTRDDLNSDLPRWRLEFTYDYMGRRVVKKTRSWDITNVWNNDEEMHFIYQGWNLIAELDAIQSMQIHRSYVWGTDLSGSLSGAGGVGGLLMVRVHSHVTAEEDVYYPSYDGNGNVVGLTDAATGLVAALYEYGPFGETIRMTGPAAEINPFRFSTKYQDELSDLYYYGFRYYNPSMGRWLNKDPIEEQGGLHLYGFVGNDPVSRTDYLGLADLSMSLFFHWLGETGTPVRLQWSDFDNDGSAKNILKTEWTIQNHSMLKELCKSSECGSSYHPGSRGKRINRLPSYSNKNPWISEWRGDTWNHDSGILLEKDCKNCVCKFEFGLNFYAYDMSDFDPGGEFGPWGMFKDDWFILIRDNVPLVGADFLIYANSYDKFNHQIRWE